MIIYMQPDTAKFAEVPLSELSTRFTVGAAFVLEFNGRSYAAEVTETDTQKREVSLVLRPNR